MRSSCDAALAADGAEDAISFASVSVSVSDGRWRARSRTSSSVATRSLVS